MSFSDCSAARFVYTMTQYNNNDLRPSVSKLRCYVLYFDKVYRSRVDFEWKALDELDFSIFVFIAL